MLVNCRGGIYWGVGFALGAGEMEGGEYECCAISSWADVGEAVGEGGGRGDGERVTELMEIDSVLEMWLDDLLSRTEDVQ